MRFIPYSSCNTFVQKAFFSHAFRISSSCLSLGSKLSSNQLRWFAAIKSDPIVWGKIAKHRLYSYVISQSRLSYITLLLMSLRCLNANIACENARETPLGPGAKKDGCFRRLMRTDVSVKSEGIYLIKCFSFIFRKMSSLVSLSMAALSNAQSSNKPLTKQIGPILKRKTC